MHNLSGGRRVLERLGPDDAEIAFQGIFSGPNAEARVRAFDDLRLSGEVVWLTWETFRRRVVVKSFLAEYHSPWWIPYKVSCIVAYQSGIAATKSTVAALISSDLGNALAAIAGTGFSVGSLQGALSATNAMTTGTVSNLQAVGVVGTTLDLIDGQIDQQSTTVATPGAPNADPATLCRTFGSMVGGAGLLTAAVNARSYVGRIGRILDGAGI
ncbi:hypothetical protein [Rhodopila sp.]|uniref:hypothetical protein n=1 Tax=Rhodopila sp. TaxID=2480087 RepID=UPI003D12FB04